MPTYLAGWRGRGRKARGPYRNRPPAIPQKTALTRRSARRYGAYQHGDRRLAYDAGRSSRPIETDRNTDHDDD